MKCPNCKHEFSPTPWSRAVTPSSQAMFFLGGILLVGLGGWVTTLLGRFATWGGISLAGLGLVSFSIYLSRIGPYAAPGDGSTDK